MKMVLRPAMFDPWADIPPSENSQADNLRRIDANHPLGFWWGRDHLGRCLLVLDLTNAEFKRRFPELAGIDISLFTREDKTGQLVLTLLDFEDRAIFHSLCGDLVEATKLLSGDDPRTNLEVVLGRLRRWQELFRRRREQLSQAEVIGLFGELLFLRDCLLPRVPVSLAVPMWRGAYGDEQDFVVGKSIVEVKTQLSTTDHALLISSENQLDTRTAPIILVHQTIGQSSVETSSAFSLNTLVSQIKAIVSKEAPDALEAFEDSLSEARYAPLPVYDEPIWALVRRDAYDVKERFPRITPADLRPGVERVRYQVRLENCSPFLRDIGDLLGERLDV